MTDRWVVGIIGRLLFGAISGYLGGRLLKRLMWS